MTVSMKVSVNDTQPPFFGKTFTKQEFGKLSLGRDQRIVSPILLYARRTDTLENACKDLFFPMLLGLLSSKTNTVALKIFLAIPIFVFDLMLLPVRLLTLIPRCFYNLSHTKESHPFYKYLAQQPGVDPKVHLAKDSVYVRRREIDSQHDIKTEHPFCFVESFASGRESYSQMPSLLHASHTDRLVCDCEEDHSDDSSDEGDHHHKTA